MEYCKENLLSREELAALVEETYAAKAEYTRMMRSWKNKEEVRGKAYAYYRLRDKLLEVSRSIIMQSKLQDR